MIALLIIIAGIIIYFWVCNKMTKLGNKLQEIGNSLIESACSLRGFHKRPTKTSSKEAQKISDKIRSIKQRRNDDYKKRVREEIERLTRIS